MVCIVLIVTVCCAVGIFNADDNFFAGMDIAVSKEYATARISQLTQQLEEGMMTQEGVDRCEKEIEYMQYVIENDIALEDIENLTVYSGFVLPVGQNKSMRPFLYIDMVTICVTILAMIVTYQCFLRGFDNGMIKTILMTNINRKSYFRSAFMLWIGSLGILIFAICIGFSLSFVGVPHKLAMLYVNGNWQAYSVKGIAVIKMVGSIIMVVTMASVCACLGMTTGKPLYITIAIIVFYFAEIGISFLVGQELGEMSIVNFLPFLSIQNVEKYNDILTYSNLIFNICVSSILIWLARRKFLKRDIV